MKQFSTLKTFLFILAVSLAVTAKAAVDEVATLPFMFNSGRAAIANTPGMTQVGLASDYSSGPTLKFDTSTDRVIIHFTQPACYVSYKLSGWSFSGGTFKVQESADGETYTNVHVHTADLVPAGTDFCDPLQSTSRYVRFVYAERESGNVGLGNILIAPVSYTQSISAAGYATMCLPFNATAPAGAELYYGRINAEGTSLTLVSTNQIKSGEGYILKAPKGEYTFTTTTEAVEAPSDNVLVGVHTATSLSALQNNGTNNVYGLSYDASRTPSVQFNLASGGTLAAFKACLVLPKSGTSQVAEFISVAGADEATGLSQLTAEPQGQDTFRTRKMIENGRLVIQRHGTTYHPTGQRVR